MRKPVLALTIVLACIAAACARATDGADDAAGGRAADYDTSVPTKNIDAKGHSLHPASFSDPAPGRHINSDLAFWGTVAYHGNYDGFRIIDISKADYPVELAHQRCNGDQGDIVVWDKILLRAWNSPAPPGRFCDGEPVPGGFEGVHVFDVADPRNPTLVAAVELECGSHTVTVAGIVGPNLIVYSNNEISAGCVDGTPASDDPAGDYMDVIEVPLKAPSNAKLLRREALAGPTTAVPTGCHDVGVIRGAVNKAACASADTINVWDVGANRVPGGSLVDPELLFTISEPGVGQEGTNGRWHSAAFTWDGKVLVAAWEPGGGSEAKCEPGDPNVDKSLFFYDGNTGAKLGQWVLPRAQGADESCTMHNFNIVPLPNGRYLTVGGHYQAGTWVTDFSDPGKPVTVAWSDPPSLGPGPFCDPDGEGPLPGQLPGQCQRGGAWSSYWYNSLIYESDITKGLNVLGLTAKETGGALPLPRLNPQTQEFSLP
ncbi:MAG TPA: hypothetical protein VK988_00045 [Acidimicrobiales bacterium]|nr:hypothetical protein [Acidimicrobiales bacterium]